ncbi:DUF3455 domain-containing protein [Umezawaea sp.]|uniref:DUF3455 domain-containing protein n=1 Tax=Umezawaea sp. TaxID=1955258 RepID=UPI002ED133BD
MKRVQLIGPTLGALALAGVTSACGDERAPSSSPAAEKQDVRVADEDAEPVVPHSRGPVRVSTVDGSAVEAAAVDGAEVDRPGAIPELLLKAKAVRGDGLLGGATYVQRLNTEGGVAPAGTCEPDAQVSVPYTALCTFYESA